METVRRHAPLVMITGFESFDTRAGSRERVSRERGVILFDPP
jgi:hypothetical protein